MKCVNVYENFYGSICKPTHAQTHRLLGDADEVKAKVNVSANRHKRIVNARRRSEMKQKIADRARQLGLKKHVGQLDFKAKNSLGLWNPPSQAIVRCMLRCSPDFSPS